MSPERSPEMAWFAALCDDDYDYLGVRDEQLESSWEHCRGIVVAAEATGFDSVLLPSGYALGIDSVAFAAGIATATETIRLLLAVRMGEMVLPQLARQLATIDQMAGGRLLVNVISSEIPGETLASEPRYRRTLEHMTVLRQLLKGEPVDFSGEFVDLHIDPPRAQTVRGAAPPFYFGGLSEAAKACAAAGADVYLMWPDTPEAVADVVTEMHGRAAEVGRALRCGWRSHVIVADTEAQARAEAGRLISRLDPVIGEQVRARSLDTTSAGVSRQNALRAEADADGYVTRHLWTGIGRARSGAGAAIVGDPDQVMATIGELGDAGVDTFILSGYPHLETCRRFGDLVLSKMDHAPLVAAPSCEDGAASRYAAPPGRERSTPMSSRRILITGGSRGIGAATAAALLAARGDRVALHCGSHLDAAQALVGELPGDGHMALAAELADEGAVDAMVDEVVERLGGIDTLINNAGIYEDHPPTSTSYADWTAMWRRIVDVNVIGTAAVTWKVVDHLVGRAGGPDGGRIVMVGSRGAYRGEPSAPAYGASKAAVHSMAQSLAVALAPHGIIVSAVAPGFTDTERTESMLAGEAGRAIWAQSPFGRTATAAEVAAAIAWLASDDARWAAGAVLDLNGASYLR